MPNYTLVFTLLYFWLSGCIAAESPKRKVEMQCGGYTWAIICGRDVAPKKDDPRECNNNLLTVISPDGRATVIPPPPLTTEFHNDRRPVMLEGTTPSAMRCFSNQNHFYASVMYSRDPSTVGTFYELFNDNGTRLTMAGRHLYKGFKNPYEGIDRKQLPILIKIEEE
jgi:hypothetical protein